MSSLSLSKTSPFHETLVQESKEIASAFQSHGVDISAQQIKVSALLQQVASIEKCTARFIDDLGTPRSETGGKCPIWGRCHFQTHAMCCLYMIPCHLLAKCRN